MDHHSRLTPEKLPKNHMELLSSFLRRLRLRIMIWLQKHRANTLKPNCSHWLHYKVHRNPWKETKYSGHSIKRDHIKVPGHHLDPLPKHTDGTPPGPLHSHLGALPSLLQKPLQPLDPIFPGLVSQGYVHLDQVPEGEAWDPHIFKSAASSTMPGT